MWPQKAEKRRATVLAGLIVLQAICALVFVADVVADFLMDGQSDHAHLILESIAAIALASGVFFLMIELRNLFERMSHMQTGLDIARGHLADVIEAFFDEWKLTSAERDVAIMILKGLDNDAIARLRNTASGTVRAQATSVYSKSSTGGRAQFICLFMEELMAGEIVPDDHTPHASSSTSSAEQPAAPTHST